MHDVIVVGGSFAGLSGAIQLARARRQVLVIDSGQPRNRFAQASHGFFGLDGVSPFDAIRNAREQLLALRRQQEELERQKGDLVELRLAPNVLVLSAPEFLEIDRRAISRNSGADRTSTFGASRR